MKELNSLLIEGQIVAGPIGKEAVIVIKNNSDCYEIYPISDLIEAASLYRLGQNIRVVGHLSAIPSYDGISYPDIRIVADYIDALRQDNTP